MTHLQYTGDTIFLQKLIAQLASKEFYARYSAFGVIRVYIARNYFYYSY